MGIMRSLLTGLMFWLQKGRCFDLRKLGLNLLLSFFARDVDVESLYESLLILLSFN